MMVVIVVMSGFHWDKAVQVTGCYRRWVLDWSVHGRHANSPASCCGYGGLEVQPAPGMFFQVFLLCGMDVPGSSCLVFVDIIRNQLLRSLRSLN